jgi:energy-converting hydrogenase A subunit M
MMMSEGQQKKLKRLHRRAECMVAACMDGKPDASLALVWMEFKDLIEVMLEGCGEEEKDDEPKTT